MFNIDPIFIKVVLALVIAYLLGSIPCGLWIGKLFYRVDIRDYGSGRTGGTNVLRTCGKVAFVFSIVGDFLKAFFAVVIAGKIMQDATIIIVDAPINSFALQSMAGLAAVFGHIWPVFANFRGGRGVASFMGGVTALCPWVGIFAVLVLALIVTTTKFMSLASIVSVVGAYVIMIPFTLIGSYPNEYMAYVMIGSVLIVIAHSDNIQRLLTGKERKVGQKAQKNV